MLLLNLALLFLYDSNFSILLVLVNVLSIYALAVVLDFESGVWRETKQKKVSENKYLAESYAVTGGDKL